MNDLSQLKPKLVRLKLSGVLETLDFICSEDSKRIRNGGTARPNREGNPPGTAD
jgi:hypothetical protein